MSGGSGAELLPPDTLPVKATGKLKVVIPGGGGKRSGASSSSSAPTLPGIITFSTYIERDVGRGSEASRALRSPPTNILLSM